MGSYRSRAFVFHGPGRMACEEIGVDCGPEEVVVRVLASARCGTDKTIYCKGHAKVKPPRILGHELAAEIVEIGPEVRNLRRGIGYRE